MKKAELWAKFSESPTKYFYGSYNYETPLQQKLVNDLVEGMEKRRGCKIEIREVEK